MATIVLTNKTSVFAVESKPSQAAQAAAKQAGETLILDDVATAPAGAVFEVGDAVWGYNLFAKKAQKFFKILKDVPSVADAGEYLDATLANWKKYVPPVLPEKGDLMPAIKARVIVDSVKVRAGPSTTDKVLKTLTKGTTRDLEELYGLGWFFSKADKGYVSLTDGKGKFFWGIVKADGTAYDTNTGKPLPKKETSPGFGIKPAEPAMPQVIVKPEGGMSTPMILAIAGGVVLLLLLATTPSGGRRTARA